MREDLRRLILQYFQEVKFKDNVPDAELLNMAENLIDDFTRMLVGKIKGERK